MDFISRKEADYVCIRDTRSPLLNANVLQIYCDGKLLFCDHIFNGYGNTRKDFKKQVMKSRHDAIQGHYLPKDFRFR